MDCTLQPPASPDDVLDDLMEGNRRFAKGAMLHPHQDMLSREVLCSGQQPRAAILGCSDSRISPEILFDQGLGDLFVVRVAGNLVTDTSLGSIEYAVHHFNLALVMVLAHSGCGAVTATVGDAQGDGCIPAVIDAIRPAVEKVRDKAGNTVENASRTNARIMAARLKEADPYITEAVKEGSLRVVAAYYDQETGLVNLL